MPKYELYSEFPEQVEVINEYDVGKALSKLEVDFEKVEHNLRGKRLQLKFKVTLPEVIREYRGEEKWSNRGHLERDAVESAIYSMHKLIGEKVEEGFVIYEQKMPGMSIGPHYMEDNKPVKDLTFEIDYNQNSKEMLKWLTCLFLSVEDRINISPKITLELYKQPSWGNKLKHTLSGRPYEPIIKFDMELEKKEKPSVESREFVEFYSNPLIEELVKRQCINRQTLYLCYRDGWVFRRIRKTEGGVTKPIEIFEGGDVPEAVAKYSVREFIPSVNKKDEPYPSRMTIELDPEKLYVNVLGWDKAWKVITKIAQKICNFIDEYFPSEGGKPAYIEKFSGNKGWHTIIPIEVKEPFEEYQDIVSKVMEGKKGIKDPIEEKDATKEYMDPFYQNRVVGQAIIAYVQAFELGDLMDVLSLNDLIKLGNKVEKLEKDDRYDGYVYEENGVKYKVPLENLISIRPQDKISRQGKILGDISSNHIRGKIQAEGSLKLKSLKVSMRAQMEHMGGMWFFKPEMYDREKVLEIYDMKNVIENEAFWREISEHDPEIRDTEGYRRMIGDLRNIIFYLLSKRHGPRRWEHGLDAGKMRWVARSLISRIESQRGAPLLVVNGEDVEVKDRWGVQELFGTYRGFRDQYAIELLQNEEDPYKKEVLENFKDLDNLFAEEQSELPNAVRYAYDALEKVCKISWSQEEIDSEHLTKIKRLISKIIPW